MNKKLGILLTHPIQYYSPWFKYLANKIDIEVFYAHKQDSKGQAKAGFGVGFEWDVPLLEGYSYTWLKNVSSNPGLGTFFGCDTPEINNIIRNSNFSAFLIIGWNYKSALQAIYACRKYKIPILHRGDSNLLTSRSKIKLLAKYLPYKILLSKINYHLYVGKLNKEYLKYYGVKDNNLFFSPHFIDNNFFRSKLNKIENNNSHGILRDKLGISRDSYVLIFVGKFINKKRPFDILKAVIKILNENRNIDIHVIFVGDGPLKSELINKSKEYSSRFHFTGFINQNDIYKYYFISDCLVLPSNNSETWGLVVNEAMACGLPVIVSNAVGSGYDMVEEGKTGFVYEIGEIDSLTRVILKIDELIKKDKKKLENNIYLKSNKYSMEIATQGLMSALEKS